MMHKHKNLHNIPSSTHQFLVLKTDLGHLERRQGDKTGIQHTAFLEILKKDFPEILSGYEFITGSMAMLEPFNKFGTLALRFDNFTQAPGVSRKDHVAGILVDMAKTIDTLCKEEEGFWGHFDRDLLGCFFPGIQGDSSLKLAEKIKKTFAGYRSDTVTIGVSTYPTIDFKKNQILENACKALDHASFFGPDSTVLFDSVSLNISGDNLYQSGNIEGAKDDFKRALLMDPSNVNVHNSLGVCYGVMNSFDNALEEFETAISINPDEYMSIYNAGLVYMLRDEYDKALEYFLDAGKKKEGVFEILFQTGRVYLKMKKLQPGKEYLEKAVSLNPKSGAAFRYLGDCFNESDMTDEAMAAYNKAIKLNPNDAASLSAMGYMFEISGENPEIALIFCRQSVDITPDNGLFRHRLGRLYLKMNRFEEALKEFKKANLLGHNSMDFIDKTHNMLEEIESLKADE